jgi:isopenicillin-N N-acyltransferase-like protein
MEEELGLAWREALRRGRIHLERLSAHAPDYLAALKGLAKGAKISEEEAGLLDARYEIFYFAYAKEAGQECTSLAVFPERSAYRELILAQNWDWIPGIQGAWLLFESPDFQVLAFTEAGIPGGKIGINSAGLGLCVNGVFSPWDRWGGVTLLRAGLDGPAIPWFGGGPGNLPLRIFPLPRNFLFGQKDEAVSLERAPPPNLRIDPPITEC